MASSRFDPEVVDRSYGATSEATQASPGTEASSQVGGPEGVNLLGVIGQAERISRDYQSRTIERSLNRSYRAWQNQHAEGSKYLGASFKGRSRLFVPKTRSAVRKNLATAAASLFATEEVVSVTADYQDDPIAMATADVIKADMDYRMTRSSVKSGMPWYQISMGACLDAQLTGVCVSKQYWEYEEVEDGVEKVAEILADEVTGEPYLDEIGQPITYMVERPRIRVVRDRPMIDIHPIENVGMDPAAPWYDPAQLGRWFFVRYPMGLSDLHAYMKTKRKNGDAGGWLDVSDEVLMKGRIDETRASQRRARENGSDRYEDAKAPGSPLDIVWIQENFVRIDGVDYTFWSVGRHAFLTEVRPTIEVYPEFDGMRPYVMGQSQLDTHRPFPMSPVESWQPLQLELNDITNLRQDTLKRSIAPLTLVKRGKNVDLTQVQRRGQPDAVVLVDNTTEDVVFHATPGPTSASYTETSLNSAMFDELAGVFSTSSVMSSRQLNETATGMKAMSGAANAVSEFDLRMWIETWVEPVLRQIMHLIRRLESDERVMAIAGAKARVWSTYGVIPTLSDFDQTDLMVRVNAGIGALDPMQKLAKMRQAFEMLAPIMPEAKAKGITLNVDQVITEVMGAAGFKDGKRFFEYGQPQQEGPPPEIQIALEELKVEREKMQSKFQEAMAELQSDQQMAALKSRTAIEVEKIKNDGRINAKVIDINSQRQMRQEQSAAASYENAADRQLRVYEMLANRLGRTSSGGKSADGKSAASTPPALPKKVETALMDKAEQPMPPSGPEVSQMQDVMLQMAQQMQAMGQQIQQMQSAFSSLVQQLMAPPQAQIA